jgi:hypothetical protein
VASFEIDGKQIDLTLTIGRVRIAKEKHAINIADIVDDKSSIRFLAVDPVILSDVLWALYHDRLQQAGIGGKKQLDELMDSKTVASAYAGLKEEFKDFFPWGAGFCQMVEGLKDLGPVPIG